MTIEQSNVVDLIGENEEEKYLSLIISDHLEWDIKNEKLLLLQDKINCYLSFIESGQIYEQYPACKNYDIHIVLTSMHEPSSEGLKFLAQVEPIIREAGFHFKWNVAESSS